MYKVNYVIWRPNSSLLISTPKQEMYDIIHCHDEQCHLSPNKNMKR